MGKNAARRQRQSKGGSGDGGGGGTRGKFTAPTPGLEDVVFTHGTPP